MANITGNDNPNTLYGDLRDFAEDDSIRGLGGDDILYGRGVVDIINGGDGNDWLHAGSGNNQGLYGGDGNDTMLGDGIEVMQGGAGDDLYYVNHEYDSVIKELNDGVDVVRASISYTLTGNVEKLVLEGNSTVSKSSLNLC